MHQLTVSPSRRGRMARACVLAASLAAVPTALGQSSFQSLGDLPGGLGAQGFGVSADGSVVAGLGFSQSRAFRWTQADGMHALFESGLDFTYAALSISADGLTIGGPHTIR